MDKIYYKEFQKALIKETDNQVFYSYDKCIEILIKQGMDIDEAIDYLDFNFDNMKYNFPKFI